MKPGVFISHKLNDPVTDSFLGQLRPLLEAAGCHVWIDTDIAGGEVWRRELGTWMSCCTCAVILIGRAALQSSWIFQEASILSWRQEQDKSFLLLPIVLDGLTDAEIGGSPLKVVLDLLRLQSPGRSGNTRAKLAGTIAEVEKHHAANPAGDNEFTRSARAIAALLKGADEASITRAADLLGIDLDPWIPGWQPPSAFALKLLSAESEQLIDVLEEIGVPPEVKGQIGRLVLPFWVDTRAAEMVRRMALLEADRPLLLLNSDYPPTAEDYARRASFSPYSTWKVHHSHNVYGEDFAGDLWNEVCLCIARSAGWDDTVTSRPAVMRGKVENLLKVTGRKAPQFITMAVGTTADWAGLEQLRRDHGRVIYLLLGGAAAADPPECGEARAEFVCPALPQEREGIIDGIRTYIELIST